VLQLDGTHYPLGTLAQTAQAAYWNASQPDLVRVEGWGASRSDCTTAPPGAAFAWTPGGRGSPPTAAWPPRGLRLDVRLHPPASAPPAHAALNVTLSYELYEGAPLAAKWVTVVAPPGSDVLIGGLTVEALRLAQPYSPMGFAAGTGSVQADVTSHLYVATDQAHGPQVVWARDDDSLALPGAQVAQLAVNYSTPVSVRPAALPGGVFTSFKALLLATDTDDRERYGLSVRQVARRLTPWVLENPIFFHATDTSEAGWTTAVDQLAEVGFEMII